MTPRIGYLYSVQWYTPYHEPPDGQPRVMMQAFAHSSAPEHRPPEIMRRLEELGFGSGWSLCCQPIMPPARRACPERRGAQRVGNLRRRVTRGKGAVGPLFAEEVIEQAIQARPEYYAGAEVSPERAAYVEDTDRRDAALWAAYLAWYAVHVEKPQDKRAAPWWTPREHAKDAGAGALGDNAPRPG